MKYIFFRFYQSVGFEGNKIVFTSPEAMIISSLVSGVSKEKNKTPVLIKKPFFTTDSSRNICKFIFVSKVKEKKFPGYFFLRGKQKPAPCKESNQKS